MHASFGGSEVDQSTTQLVIDQIEELVVTIIEEIRERPGVAAAILAGLLGAIIGSMLAAGVGRRRPSPPERVIRKARGVTDVADLAALAFRLLQNPVVRGFVLSMLERQLKKRFSV